MEAVVGLLCLLVLPLVGIGVGFWLMHQRISQLQDRLFEVELKLKRIEMAPTATQKSGERCNQQRRRAAGATPRTGALESLSTPETPSRCPPHRFDASDSRGAGNIATGRISTGAP
jgi:hypothetical protein